MVGCYMAFFFKNKLKNRIDEQSLQFCKIKAGILGRAGNKGAVCLRFKIDDQSIMIMNCHLSSGMTNDQERIE